MSINNTSHNNLTPRAIQVLTLARKEADRFYHNYIGTEHLLLGLIKLGQCTAVDVLLKKGIKLEALRIAVEKQLGSGTEGKRLGSIPYTPRVKKVLNLASKEAEMLNHSSLGTEHILLGLIREGEGTAGQVLAKDFGLELESVRQTILEVLGPQFDSGGRKEISNSRLVVPGFGERLIQILSFSGEDIQGEAEEMVEKTKISALNEVKFFKPEQGLIAEIMTRIEYVVISAKSKELIISAGQAYKLISSTPEETARLMFNNCVNNSEIRRNRGAFLQVITGRKVTVEVDYLAQW